MNTSKHLFEEIISLDNLRLAHKNASKSKGHYKQIKEFNKDVENNLIAIRDMLKNKTYKNIVYHPEVRIDKGKERLLMKLDYYPLSYNDFCSVNSRLGFISYCKHIGLYDKYIKPNINLLISYYHLIINTIKQIFKTKRYALLLHIKQYN